MGVGMVGNEGGSRGIRPGAIQSWAPSRLVGFQARALRHSVSHMQLGQRGLRFGNRARRPFCPPWFL